MNVPSKYPLSESMKTVSIQITRSFFEAEIDLSWQTPENASECKYAKVYCFQNSYRILRESVWYMDRRTTENWAI